MGLCGEGEDDEEELEEEDDERRGGVRSLGGTLVLCSRSFSSSRCLSRSRFLLLSCSLSLSLSLDKERLLLRRRAGEGERRDLGMEREGKCVTTLTTFKCPDFHNTLCTLTRQNVLKGIVHQKRTN